MATRLIFSRVHPGTHLHRTISPFRTRPTVQPVFNSVRNASYTAGGARPGRAERYTRRLAYVALGAGGIYVLDRYFNASAIGRNLRTLWACAAITLDYKLNFTPEKSEQIPELHERVAERLYDLFTKNGGLYIKIGQAIGANAGLLPKPMQVKFARLFDDAPQVPYSDVVAVFEKEFGKRPEEIFDEFEEQAVASASIAQVHRAKLKGTGERVAVKVQKPAVTKQVEWDLGIYRVVMWMFEHWVFDLPVYFAVDFITDHLRQELDFEREASNATRTSLLVANEPSLSQHVYIPHVYHDLTTKRIMTAEWIDGVRFSDREAVKRLMGEKSSIAEAKGGPLAPGYPGQALKGGVKGLMNVMVELFSAQMFSWGWVHCDPHPGNILIRPHPIKVGAPQLVLLDHGLYVHVDDKVRRQYAMLWKALLSTDIGTIESIAKDWGIGAPDLFASSTLMRPVRFKKNKGPSNKDKSEADFAELSQYEQSVRMKAKLKTFLIDTDKLPKALLFLGRNIRMVQGNNQSLGSPVNRIKITGVWASRSLATAPNLALGERTREYYYYLIFRASLFGLDVIFWASKVRQYFGGLFGYKTEGFEDELERQARIMAKTTMGVDVAPGVFEG